MIALIQLKGLAKEGFSECPQRTFLKARRPVNNQAWGNPALTTQEMQAVSTAWHCAVTTYHSWAFSQPSAVWKHHSPYLSPPYHGTMLAVEHTHLSQLYRLPFSFFPFLFFFQHHICLLHLTSILVCLSCANRIHSYYNWWIYHHEYNRSLLTLLLLIPYKFTTEFVNWILQTVTLFWQCLG